MFPEKYHRALNTQCLIGWRQFFQGKISVDWLALQGTKQLDNGNKLAEHIWGANIVEHTLKSMSELWKQRNEDVHGKTASDQTKKKREALGHRIRVLHEYRDKCRPSDQYLFHENVDKFIKEAPISHLANYLKSNKKAIQNSMKQAAKGAVRGTTSIMQYFQPVNEGGITRIMRRLRDQTRYDAYGQKKKRKKKSKDLYPSLQVPLTQYISLTVLSNQHHR